MIGFTHDAKYSSRYPKTWHSEIIRCSVRAVITVEANYSKYIVKRRSRKEKKLKANIQLLPSTYVDKCIRTGTSDLRIGHLDDGDRQVARKEADENRQHHLRDSPLAALLLDFLNVPPRCMRRFYRWCGVLSHSWFWSTTSITDSDYYFHVDATVKNKNKNKKR